MVQETPQFFDDNFITINQAPQEEETEESSLIYEYLQAKLEFIDNLD